jgi:hypothetical protein
MHSQLLEGLKCESKWKTAEEGRVEMRSLAHNTWRGKGACWSSGMGLGRIDKLIHSHSLHTTHTKWLMHSWSTFGARTATVTRTHKTHRGPDLEEATTFPLIVFFATLRGDYIQMALFPGTPGTPGQESRNPALWDSWDFGAP